MTLVEAAEAMKTNPSTVCDWENGKHKPTRKSLNKLARAYNRDVSEFYEVDVATVRAEATSDIMGYFRDPKANKDRRASLSAQLLIHLPDIDTYDVPEPTEAEQSDHDLLDKGIEPDIADE